VRIALVLAVSLVLLSAPPAFAAAPTVKQTWTDEPGGFTPYAPSVCSLDITVTTVGSGTYTEWDNPDGSGMAIRRAMYALAGG